MLDVIELNRRRSARRELPAPSDRRRLRLRAGLSQDDVAALIGVSRPVVTRWEWGLSKPRAGRNYEAYAELLDRLAVAP